MKRRYLPVVALLLISCSLLGAPVVPAPQAITILPTATVVTPTPLPTPTLAPYEQYTIDYLRKRTYGGGILQVLEKLAENDSFISYSIRYPSEGPMIEANALRARLSRDLTVPKLHDVISAISSYDFPSSSRRMNTCR